MRFVFRLQAVLDLRLRAEQEAERVFAAAQGRVAEVEARIAGMEEKRARVQSALGVSAPFDERLAARQWCDVVAREVARAQHERETLAAIAAARQQDLAALSAERRAVEKLRERAWAEHQAEVQRREQIALDEIATLRHGRF